jgi:hypothetical protein
MAGNLSLNIRIATSLVLERSSEPITTLSLVPGWYHVVLAYDVSNSLPKL